MAYVYSDAERETDEHALPNIEVFYLNPGRQAVALIEAEADLCFDVAANHGQIFENVKRMLWFVEAVAEELEGGFYWQACFPGCLPDGEPSGPFETEAEATADAQSSN